MSDQQSTEVIRTWKHAKRERPMPPGPWNDEPDKAQWIDASTGLDCLIVRGPMNALCGYVGVPREHSWHGKGYSQHLDVECGEEYCYQHTPDGAVDVHGGLTFSDSCQEGTEEGHGICHIPEPGRPDDVWWFGFDCAHAGDVSPYEGMPSFPGETYRDFAYVRGQVAQLAQQLAEVAR